MRNKRLPAAWSCSLRGKTLRGMAVTMKYLQIRLVSSRFRHWIRASAHWTHVTRARRNAVA